MENYNNEIWKFINGFEGLYEVSSEGRVRTVARIMQRRHKSGTLRDFPVKSVIKKPFQTKIGYVTMALCKENKTLTTYLHRIIAEAFIPRNQDLKLVVNHKNGIKNDNRIENLEWVTSGENNVHALDTGLKSVKGAVSKEFKNSVLEMKKLNLTNKEIANKLNSSTYTVSGITGGRSHKRV